MSVREQYQWLPDKGRQQRKSTMLKATIKVDTRRIDKRVSHRLIARVQILALTY